MARLALKGGAKVFPQGMAVTWPVFDQRDEESLLKVFRSGKWWRGGTLEDQAASECGKFEKAFAAFQNAGYGLAVSNGTVALELALRAAGVKPGDEVIVPALSFVVSASAVLPLGGVPVFADCDPVTYQPAPAAIEALINRRTRCICIVHFAGYPADLDRIVAIAHAHGIPLVEDSAHSQGSQWRGKGLGSYGDFGTFSFQQSKSLPAGEGGIVLTNDIEKWRAVYRFHNLGRLEHSGFYDFHEMSSNYRLTDLQGALLNTQFEKLKEAIPVRMEGARRLSASLRKIGGVEPLPDDSRITRRGYFYYIFKYDPRAFKGLQRELFLEALKAEGVNTVGHSYGQAINRYPLFQNLSIPRRHRNAQYKKVHCPAAEKAMTEELCTFSHATLLQKHEVLDRIAEAVAKIKDNVDEILPVGGAGKE